MILFFALILGLCCGPLFVVAILADVVKPFSQMNHYNKQLDQKFHQETMKKWAEYTE